MRMFGIFGTKYQRVIIYFLNLSCNKQTIKVGTHPEIKLI